MNILVYKLIKSGYGKYKDMINLPINIFMDMVNYEKFLNDYEKVYSQKLHNKNNNK